MEIETVPMTIVSPEDGYDVWIGEGSIWANPFFEQWIHRGDTSAKRQVKDRRTALHSFEQWLLGADFIYFEQDVRGEIVRQLLSLRGKRLACPCGQHKTGLCHGCVYIDLLS
jgi:hypothetical protein